jgi:hypothetical protein
MAQTVEDQIIDNVIALMKTITTTNGYNQTVRPESVSAETMGLGEAFTSYPAIDMFYKVRKSDESDHGWQVNIMELSIGAYVDDRNNPRTALSTLAGDVEAALAENERELSNGVAAKLGGFATDMALIGTDYEFMRREGQSPFTGYASIDLEIEFEHPRDDPFNTD